MLNSDTIDFIKFHINDDVNKLVLSKINHPSINLKFAALQILARQKSKNKLPEWYSNMDIIFPSIVSVEQSSSYLTAIYKQRFSQNKHIADITGGFGVDSFYFAKNAIRVYYYEINPQLAEIAKHNYEKLNQRNIFVETGNYIDFASQDSHLDLIYADPSRRSSESKRKIKLTDYEPNIPLIKNFLFRHSNFLLIKISPMADISATLTLLPETIEIHIVSVNNECKELLFLLNKDNSNNQISIFTANLFPDSERDQYFNFELHSEKSSQSIIDTSHYLKYIYEPNSSILKSGAFKIIGDRLQIKKLHQHTHLYSSNEFINNFPGKAFSIVENLPFSKKSIELINSKYDKANISTRNFPMTTNELRQRLKTNDGGDIFIFGVTVFDNTKRLLVCTKTD